MRRVRRDRIRARVEHSRRVVRLGFQPRGGAAAFGRSCAGRRTSISKGSDQHRGWFHSSLLVGIGTRGRAPFDQVLTHGFVVDEQGRKMSKSIGNTIVPQDVIKQSGADVLRLWVSMVDYREDIRLGKEILARVVESYRKFRNVLRVLMANLYDFDPVADAVPRARHARDRSLGDGALRQRGVEDRQRLRRVRLSRRSIRRRARSSPSI